MGARWVQRDAGIRQTGRQAQLAQLLLPPMPAASCCRRAGGMAGAAPSLLLLRRKLLGRGLRLRLAAPHQAAPELVSEAHRVAGGGQHQVLGGKRRQHVSKVLQAGRHGSKGERTSKRELGQGVLSKACTGLWQLGILQEAATGSQPAGSQPANQPTSPLS